MSERLKEIAFLYGLFTKIGLFSIGGGYVMLPMLEDELVRKRQWVTHDELLDYYAIGQSTPGTIAVNTSTFIGFKRQGVWGSLAATAGMVTPSLVIICIIAAFVPQMQANAVVQKAFMGIRVAVAALLLHTLYKLVKKGWKGVFDVIITLVAFILVAVLGVSPIFVIIGAGIVGFSRGRLKGRPQC